MDSHSHRSSLARTPLLRTTCAHRAPSQYNETRHSNAPTCRQEPNPSGTIRQQLLLTRFRQWRAHATASTQRHVAGTRAPPRDAAKDLRKHCLLAIQSACGSVALLSGGWAAILVQAASHARQPCAPVAGPLPCARSRVNIIRHVHPLVQRVRHAQSRAQMPADVREQLSLIVSPPWSGNHKQH